MNAAKKGVKSKKNGPRETELDNHSDVLDSGANSFTEDEALFLSKEELLEVKLAEAEERALRAEVLAEQLQRTMYLMQIDPQGKVVGMDQKIQSKMAAFNKLQEKQKQKIQLIEARLRIRLSDYSFDEETGKLYINKSE